MYEPYKRRIPRKRPSDYIMPFVIILILVGIVFASWNALNKFFIGGSISSLDEKVQLNIEGGSAKAMTVGKEEWKNVPDNISLYAGEKIMTGADGWVSLDFFEGSTVSLDHSTELEFITLRKKNEDSFIELALIKGNLWAETRAPAGPDSFFRARSELLTVRAEEAVFAMESPGTVYMVEGSADIDVRRGEDVVKTVRLGVGQELVVDDVVVGDIEKGLDPDIIFAMNDFFKDSDWYRWNMGKGEPQSSVFPESPEERETVMEEADGTAMEEETEETPADPDDKTPPASPVITEPLSGDDGDSVELEDVSQFIRGTVSADTHAVIVNDYRLTRYVPGEKTFQYSARTAYGNLKAGKNEFLVYAEDEAGNRSEPAQIILILPQEVIDEKSAEAEEEEEDENVEENTPAASSSGGVSITEPNGGKNFHTSKTSFEIRGTVPSNTAKVIVNDYQLSAFELGDTSFLYRANSTIGSLEIGAKNTYTVKAYDEEDALIGTASMTIDVESGENGAPVITIPTADGAYSTSLDEIVLGGTVGKWITRVYINGQNLNEYIPGAEEWKKTVTLQPGDNVFTVESEKEGVKTGKTSITINYQP